MTHAVRMVGLAGGALLMNVNIAVACMVMVFPRAHGRRDVAYLVPKRRSRRHAERQGGDQQEQCGKQSSKKQHGAV